jgi:hypothetical protein
LSALPQEDAMNIANPRSAPAGLTVILTLAQLLERMERTSAPVAADQYRAVVRHLATALGGARLDPWLQAVLDAHPATAELYENLNYDQAGLCLTPLDAAMAAEIEAREAISAARRQATA